MDLLRLRTPVRDTRSTRSASDLRRRDDLVCPVPQGLAETRNAAGDCLAGMCQRISHARRVHMQRPAMRWRPRANVVRHTGTMGLPRTIIVQGEGRKSLPPLEGRERSLSRLTIGHALPARDAASRVDRLSEIRSMPAVVPSRTMFINGLPPGELC